MELLSWQNWLVLIKYLVYYILQTRTSKVVFLLFYRLGAEELSVNCSSNRPTTFARGRAAYL